MKVEEEKNSVSTPNLTVLFVLKGLLGLWCVLCFRYFWNHMGDDSYIFFRYADHLAHHNSLEWNIQGSSVEGFSSPLWVLWLGVLGRWLDIVVVARWTGCVCLLAACWQIVRQRRSGFRPELKAMRLSASAMYAPLRRRRQTFWRKLRLSLAHIRHAIVRPTQIRAQMASKLLRWYHLLPNLPKQYPRQDRYKPDHAASSSESRKLQEAVPDNRLWSMSPCGVS